MSSKQARTNDRSRGKNRPPIVRHGIYDGSQSSDDILVTGHSTGALNTEMDALSHQVSIDAGRVPDYPVDDVVGANFEAQRAANQADRDAALYDEDDLDLSGGPGLYGPKPDLLSARQLDGSAVGGRSIWKIALWGLAGVAGVAAISALSYGAYRVVKARTQEA